MQWLFWGEGENSSASFDSLYVTLFFPLNVDSAFFSQLMWKRETEREREEEGERKQRNATHQPNSTKSDSPTSPQQRSPTQSTSPAGRRAPTRKIACPLSSAEGCHYCRDPGSRRPNAHHLSKGSLRSTIAARPGACRRCFWGSRNRRRGGGWWVWRLGYYAEY